MKWMNDPVRVAAGEEGIEPGLMRVRVALMQLPQLSCPVGFEHRLQRRLAGVRTAGNSRGWTLGWLGAGLGFAAAFAVSVIVFNLSAVSPNNPASTVAESPVSTEAPSMAGSQTPVNTETPSLTETAPQQLASETVPPGTAPRDSQSVTSPTTLPQDLYHVVGGHE